MINPVLMTVSLLNCGDVTAQLGLIKTSECGFTCFAREQDNNVSLIGIMNIKIITNI